jgi:hypothetical protein
MVLSPTFTSGESQILFFLLQIQFSVLQIPPNSVFLLMLDGKYHRVYIYRVKKFGI